MRLRARHTSFSEAPGVAAKQSSENARDINAALDEKVSGRLVEVNGYSATASVTALVNVAWPNGRPRPRAVMIANCYPVDDAAASVQASTFRNFYYTPGSLGVYEPSGLTLNKIYNITFLILE